MSDTLLKLFGGAILCVLVTVILKKESPDSATVLRMLSGVVLAVACIYAVSPLVEYILEIGEGFSASNEIYEAAEVLVKALGVSLLTHICATVCRDSGEGSLAGYVELGGKIEIMILSLPLLRGLLDTAFELLEMS